MNKKEALEIVRPKLTDHRYVHTLGVLEVSVMLAEKYGADVKKAEMAAIFHDYAKFRPKEEMRQIVKEESLPEDLLYYGTELLHAPVGACLVKKEAGIDDEEILRAIYYHTTGNVNMSLLEKIIFLADYIEPNRHFSGVEEVREAAILDLDKACLMAVRNTIQFLIRQNQKIYPLSIAAYNALMDEVNKKK
ncbi:bis(5'-nucleosyl)-tetraphosphatase (symmetrical) YqeK [Bacillus sp. NEB1478]|uniref:bis(5'-nucleosyl)-tetraphosphatase (symmetrical) YqeK n=1 Tax=Bacillus sp. NEB1478 TaxID=3073816 RepID=UPI00287333D7|nr:bis(5'-nucleosyl)-tetraphosphatase (symmetrical) YqeK [Bacillus sp. NEB1478]WNB93453.1 bis(5'-nucleosyl)-tetraphosphatase (symmetrical) YqeK [Bacillus sp. NEB1478]